MPLFCGFPKGNQGVFRTTGDRDGFFWRLWIPYGYPIISDPLQNWRRLPLTNIDIKLYKKINNKTKNIDNFCNLNNIGVSIFFFLWVVNFIAILAHLFN